MFDRKKAIQIASLIIVATAALYASKVMFLSRAEDTKSSIEMILPAVEFDESMQLQKYQHLLENETMTLLYKSFQQQYNQFHPAIIKPDAQLHIPKKMHQIWLGGNGILPEEYKEFQKSWQAFHPSWEYKLWTEKDLATFPFKNRDLFDAATNYGEKSDIWRYEILEKEGGLYLDTDYQCLAPFDVFHYTYDFYIGVQPLDTNMVQVGIGLIGARQGHPLLRAAIVNLRSSQQNQQIVAKTGPIFFTRIFYNLAKTTGLRDVAFPASYFYPCGYNQKGLDPDNWMKPESFAVHHWAGSWLRKEGFVKK